LIASADVTNIGDVSVTALPPDRISTGTEERSQLNLFMYRVAPHSTIRAGTSARQARAGNKGVCAPLTVNLYYLVTAYGAQDLHGDILLGSAMQLLNETPVLSLEMVREALRSS